MVPQIWRPTNAQMLALFGAFKARRGDPPLQRRFARIAVAEEGSAALVARETRLNKKRLAMAAAATVAGAGLGFGVHKASTGGFGFLQTNMAAEIERLTSAVGSRKVDDSESGKSLGGSEGGF